MFRAMGGTVTSCEYTVVKSDDIKTAVLVKDLAATGDGFAVYMPHKSEGKRKAR